MIQNRDVFSSFKNVNYQNLAAVNPANRNSYNINYDDTRVSFRHEDDLNTSDEHKFKPAVLIATAVGTLAPLAYILIRDKKRPHPEFNSRLAELMAEVKDLTLMAAGSIGGGLLGGMYADKGQGTWKKIKEANYQFITNNFVPVLCQAGLITAIDKYVIKKKYSADLDKLNDLIKQKELGKIKWNDKRLYFNKIMGARLLGGLAGIAGSLVAGTFISNVINNKVITAGEPYVRQAQAKDLIIQTDNVFSAMAMLKIPGIKEIVVPALSMISGYETGTK